MENHQQELPAWKQRFFAPQILWVPPVSAKPGVVYVIKRGPEIQRYAWHVATGEFTPIAIGPRGGLYATLSPDGRYLYYLRDQQGNEIGHFVRRSIDGDDEQDLTPDLPPYATFGLTISSQGNLICLTAADNQGFAVYAIDVSLQGVLSSPRLLYRSQYALYKPVLAAQSEIVVMATREYSRQRNLSLLALKTADGKTFEEQIIGNVGYWEVEDIVAARCWLLTENIAHTNQIFLTGWSYGGYLTLLALGKYPDLWAGGMACAAIADWALAYEETSPSLKSGRAARFGGTPQENPEAYVRSAPLTYAEQVKAPIFIVQGRHDTRAPSSSIEQYEAKMRALGKSIKVIWFDGGHYSLRADRKRFMAHQEALLDFAQEIIAGQEQHNK